MSNNSIDIEINTKANSSEVLAQIARTTHDISQRTPYFHLSKASYLESHISNNEFTVKAFGAHFSFPVCYATLTGNVTNSDDGSCLSAQIQINPLIARIPFGIKSICAVIFLLPISLAILVIMNSGNEFESIFSIPYFSTIFVISVIILLLGSAKYTSLYQIDTLNKYINDLVKNK